MNLSVHLPLKKKEGVEGLWSLTFPPHWKPPTWIYRTLGPRIGVSVFRISGMPTNCLKLYIYTISHFPARRFLILRQPVKLRVIALTSRNKRERERKGNKNLEKGTAKALNLSQGGVGHTVVHAKHTHPSSEFRHACGAWVTAWYFSPPSPHSRPQAVHFCGHPSDRPPYVHPATKSLSLVAVVVLLRRLDGCCLHRFSLSLPRLQFLPTFFFFFRPPYPLVLAPMKRLCACQKHPTTAVADIYTSWVQSSNRSVVRSSKKPWHCLVTRHRDVFCFILCCCFCFFALAWRVFFFWMGVCSEADSRLSPQG